MQIQVETLRHALSLLEPVVPNKTAPPAARFTLVGGGRAMATNMDVAVAIEVPEAGPDPSLGRTEEVCLPGKLVLGFLESVPGQSLATLYREDKPKYVRIDTGDQSGRFETIDPEDFPPCFPEFQPLHDTAVDGDAFTHHLKAVAPFAASKDDSRPVLTTVCLELGDRPRVITADVLPGKDLVQRFMRLGWTASHLRLNWGEVTMFIQLPQGTFPNYKQLIPTEFRAHVSFLAEDLYRALRGPSVLGRMASQGSDVIRLEWADNHLRLTARGDETGEVSMQVQATTEGPGRIAFDCRYLTEYMGGKQGMVKLSVQGEGDTAALLTYHGQANHALMPMLVRWDTPSPYPEPPKEGAEPGPATEQVPTGPTETADSKVDTAPPDAISEAPSTEADIAPDTVVLPRKDQPPTRGEAAKPRRKARNAA